MYERILVGVDGSATAAKAAARAVEVAKATGGALTMLAVGSKQRMQPALDALAKQYESTGVSIETRVVDGDPATMLVDVAENEAFDLLVVGNKGMTGATRFLLGSVPNKVSHHARSALLIVRTT
jgi:nucleotide-binding universal stress UspA family protein